MPSLQTGYLTTPGRASNTIHLQDLLNDCNKSQYNFEKYQGNRRNMKTKTDRRFTDMISSLPPKDFSIILRKSSIGTKISKGTGQHIQIGGLQTGLHYHQTFTGRTSNMIHLQDLLNDANKSQYNFDRYQGSRRNLKPYTDRSSPMQVENMQ